jgi:hypothetical protein
MEQINCYMIRKQSMRNKKKIKFKVRKNNWFKIIRLKLKNLKEN